MKYFHTVLKHRILCDFKVKINPAQRCGEIQTNSIKNRQLVFHCNGNVFGEAPKVACRPSGLQEPQFKYQCSRRLEDIHHNTECSLISGYFLCKKGKGKGKGKTIPLQAWKGPEGSRRLRLPDFKTIGTRRW